MAIAITLQPKNATVFTQVSRADSRLWDDSVATWGDPVARWDSLPTVFTDQPKNATVFTFQAKT